MDLDRYLAMHQPAWDRLRTLTRRGGRRAHKLNRDELAEMMTLYQKASADLSYVRTYHPDQVLVTTLTRTVGSAGAVIYGTRARTWRSFGRFFTRTFPAALWYYRKAMAVSAALLFVPALLAGAWIATSTDARDAEFPQSVRRDYVDRQFEEYYDSEHAAQFGAFVFTNNVQVSILAFAGGILLCVPTAYLLVNNGAAVGAVGGLFVAEHQTARFFTLIGPHGMMELTSIVIAGGAGIAMGWAFINPGTKTRGKSVIEAGRRLIVIVLGLVVTLFIAGTIEGFVTGQPWPVAIRMGIGLFAWVGFMAYAIAFGRQAAAEGRTGQFGEDDSLMWSRVGELR